MDREYIVLDGGTGGDWVYAGSGNDIGVYSVSEHLNQDWKDY